MKIEQLQKLRYCKMLNRKCAWMVMLDDKKQSALDMWMNDAGYAC